MRLLLLLLLILLLLSSSLLLLLLLLLLSSLLLLPLLLLLLSRNSRNRFSRVNHSVSCDNNHEHNRRREQHFAGEVGATKKMVYSRRSHHPNV